MSSLDHLMRCLRDRDIDVSRDELRKVLKSDQGPALESWVIEHLNHETLLSKEELALYEALEKSGDVKNLASSNDLERVQNVDDESIRDAVDQLKSSTAAIEKQTEILKIQQVAVNSLVKNNREHEKSRSSTNKAQCRAWATERGRLEVEVEEIVQALSYQLMELETQNRAADASLSQTAIDILKTDDKLLHSLEKLTASLDLEASKDDIDTQRLRDLCARLIKYTVEGVRLRLSRIYLEVSESSEDLPEDTEDEQTEVAGLQAELESLYSEILPVAQMSTEQQFLEPALKSISVWDATVKKRSKMVMDYNSQCLLSLITRLQAFSKHIEFRNSHRQTSLYIINAVRSELEAPNRAIETSMARTLAEPSSPLRRKHFQSQPMSPVRLRMARRRSSANSFEEDLSPAQALLRNLGVTFPESLTETPNNEYATIQALRNVMADRSQKLNLHAKNLQETEEIAIPDAVADANITMQSLRDTLFVETRFKTVKLRDEEIEEAIGLLEAEVERFKTEMEAVDLQRLKERNVARDNLVARWVRLDL